MNSKQPNSGAAEVTTNGLRVGDQAVFIETKATPRSLYVGIEAGVILQFRGGRARVLVRKGCSVWVDMHRLRPISVTPTLEQIFLRNMECVGELSR